MEKMNVRVEKFDDNWIFVKIARKRKPRMMVAMEYDGDKIMLQGDGTIFLIDLTKKVDGGYIARYNDRGSYFAYLNKMFGARDVIVPEEFVEDVKRVMYKKGDLMDVMPDGTPIIYGGGTLI